MPDPTLGTIAVDITALRRDVGALASGLTALADAQAAVIGLLQELLNATTGGGDEGGLAEALGEIARALEAQGETLVEIRDAVRPGAGR